MAYYRGKDIEKSRGNAIKELIIEKRNVAQVARRYGKNRSTIYTNNTNLRSTTKNSTATYCVRIMPMSD